jgi:hypothetical protein
VDWKTFITDDGTPAFVEGRGDLILEKTGQPYRNIYVSKFSISDRILLLIAESLAPLRLARLFWRTRHPPSLSRLARVAPRSAHVAAGSQGQHCSAQWLNGSKRGEIGRVS